MAGFRGIFGVALLAGAAMVAVPAVGAVSDLLRLRGTVPVSLTELGSIASFTPAIHDAKLSSAYAHAVLNRGSRAFRFTPTSGSLSGRRSITVLVRSDSAVGRADDHRTQGLGVAPLAFNLDASRGWRKFAIPDAVGSKALDPVYADELTSTRNFTLKSNPSRLQPDVQLDAKRDVGTAPQTLAGESKLSVAIGSSYSLTRNLNVTAGVRYAGPDNRLAPITDKRRDDQAVYVGTKFKF
jgi:hypothetical protein